MLFLSITLQSESSAWYMILCILGGLLVAGLLYPKKENWSKKLRIILFSLRFLSVTTLLFLLLKPFIRFEEKSYENPVLVLGVDDSHSIALVYDSTPLNQLKKSLDSLKNNLTEGGLDVQIRHIGKTAIPEKISEIRFDFPYTDFSNFFIRVGEEFDNRNLVGYVMVTDGIYNRGVFPDPTQINKPLFVIALGDTLKKKDIVLKNLIYNKNVFKGNNFPLIAELASFDLEGKTIQITIERKNKVIGYKEIKINSKKEFSRVEFNLKSDTAGKQLLHIKVAPVEGELTTANNNRSAYIDVIERKETVLIVGAVPHPDIKTLVNCFEQNDEFEVKLKIGSVSQELEEELNPSLIIFHQVPNTKNLANELPGKYVNENKPVFYILGTLTDAHELRNLKTGFTLSPAGKETDKVSASVNPSFEKFTIYEEQKSFFLKAPPLDVIYGNYVMEPGSEIILYQTVGAVMTEKPLLFINEKGGRKSAVFTGEGIWRWKLYEKSINNNIENTCELLQNIARLLITRNNTGKLKVYPLETEYLENEKVIFNAETFNEVNEKIYNKEIQLTLLKEPDSLQMSNRIPLKFSFLNNSAYEGLDIGVLSPGVYMYNAHTFINGKQEFSQGSFMIKKIQLEELNLTADPENLKRLVSGNEGNIFYRNQIHALRDSILKKPYSKRLLQTHEENIEWVHLKGLFLILLLMGSLEWALRKYFGQY